VSWIIPSFARGLDEHPPADVSVGMGIQEDLITALRQSSSWESSAFLLTYDEHGGCFDHAAPPQLDAFGLGIRVPMWVISPQAKRAHIEPTVYEHSSTLKFIERLFNLPTLASVNHLFDTMTPVGSNYEAAPSGSLAGPRPHRGTETLGSATCSNVSTGEPGTEAARLRKH
jgi:phospholipase C